MCTAFGFVVVIVSVFHTLADLFHFKFSGRKFLKPKIVLYTDTWLSMSIWLKTGVITQNGDLDLNMGFKKK